MVAARWPYRARRTRRCSAVSGWSAGGAPTREVDLDAAHPELVLQLRQVARRGMPISQIRPSATETCTGAWPSPVSGSMRWFAEPGQISRVDWPASYRPTTTTSAPRIAIFCRSSSSSGSYPVYSSTSHSPDPGAGSARIRSSNVRSARGWFSGSPPLTVRPCTPSDRAWLSSIPPDRRFVGRPRFSEEVPCAWTIATRAVAAGSDHPTARTKEPDSSIRTAHRAYPRSGGPLCAPGRSRPPRISPAPARKAPRPPDTWADRVEGRERG